MPSPTTQRDRAARKAPTDTQAALSLAREIADPYFRCQALASVARFAPESEVVPLCEEALSTARQAHDPYQTVAASAWPIRALIEREHVSHLATHIAQLHNTAKIIDNPVSAMDALFLLWQAVFPAGHDSLANIQSALLFEAARANSWKAACLLRDMAVITASQNPSAANEIAHQIPEGKAQRQAIRAIDAAQSRPPRSFF